MTPILERSRQHRFWTPAMDKLLKIMPKSIQQFTDWIQTRVGAHSNKIVWLYIWINDATGGISKWVHGKLFPLYRSIFSGVGEVGLFIVGGVKVSPEPAFGIVRDGLYYLPLDQINENFMPYEDCKSLSCCSCYSRNSYRSIRDLG